MLRECSIRHEFSMATFTFNQRSLLQLELIRLESCLKRSVHSEIQSLAYFQFHFLFSFFLGGWVFGLISLQPRNRQEIGSSLSERLRPDTFFEERNVTRGRSRIVNNVRKTCTRGLSEVLSHYYAELRAMQTRRDMESSRTNPVSLRGLELIIIILTAGLVGVLSIYVGTHYATVPCH